MSRPPADFSLPANLLKALWPLLTLPESGLVLALDELLAGKMFFFAAHRITRTGRSGSGPKKRSRMDSSPPRRTDSPRNPVLTVTPPRYALPPPRPALRSMWAASASAINLSPSHAWELQSWQGSSRAMPVDVSRTVR